MDAYFGYIQIRMHEPDQDHTSFLTNQVLLCYNVMPFGHKNACATYQRLGNKMFKEQIGHTMEVYIDDILVKSLKAGDHIESLKETFCSSPKVQNEPESYQVRVWHLLRQVPQLYGQPSRNRG